MLTFIQRDLVDMENITICQAMIVLTIISRMMILLICTSIAWHST